MSFLVYLSFNDNNVVVFTSVAFWNDAACKCQNATNSSSEIAHIVDNNSLADRFSHAETMSPVLGDDITLYIFGIGFTKALRSQATKSKQCLLSFTDT